MATASDLVMVAWLSFLGLGAKGLVFEEMPIWFWIILLVVLVSFFVLFLPTKEVVLRFGLIHWDRRELCRHILITGDTGSGKTTSGINAILSQLMRSIPDWGGLVLGVKGDEYRFLSRLAREEGRELDVIHLQVRPGDESSGWKPPHRFNLVGDRSLTWSAHAKILVDITASLVEGKQSAFFRPMAQLAISNAFALLDALGEPVTIVNAYQLLTDSGLLEHSIHELKGRNCGTGYKELTSFFESTFTRAQAFEQREAVEGTIKTFLGFFLDRDIAAVFCSDEPDTFQLSDVDHGRIITVSMPQRFVTERRYVQTHLKLLLYLHALKRFELSDSERERRNQLLLVADEFQDIATATEDGISDHTMVDRVRAAGLAIIAAVQSEISLDPVIGSAKRKVLTLNMRSRLMFRAADPDGAAAGSDFIGKKKVWKQSRSSKLWEAPTYSYREVEEYRIKPTRLLRLRDREAVIVSPSKRYGVLRPRAVR